jgi:hypothetical protein
LSAAIRRHALRSLVEAARELPLVTAPEPLPDEARGIAAYAEDLARAAAGGRPLANATNATEVTPDAGLRPAIAAVLSGLARRAEPALAASLRRAREAWDQADSFSVIDGELEGEIAGLRRRLARGATPSATAASRAIALEGLLAIDASVALVRLFERRLASLLRLRLRSATPDLLPEGRPFLDLGHALHEAAEAWR